MPTARRSTILLCLLALGGAGAVHAQVMVQPTNLAGTVYAGRSGSYRVLVRNQGEKPLTVVVETADLATPTPFEIEFPPAGSTPYSCAPWLQLSATQLDLAPGAEEHLEVTAQVPPDVAGTRHATLLVRPLPPTARPQPGGGATAAVGIIYRIAIPIDITIPGRGAAPDCRIEDVVVGAASELLVRQVANTPEAAKLHAVAGTVFNDGSAAAYVTGFAYLRDAVTQRILQKTAIPTMRVLPFSPGGFALPWPEVVPPGDYVVEIRAQYGKPARRLVATREFSIGGLTSIAPKGGIAAEAERYQVGLSPSELDVPLRPGVTTTRRLVVANPQDEPMRCTVTVRPFTVETDGTIAEAPADDAALIDDDQKSFTLPPRARRSLSVAFELPEGLAAEREHYWQVRVVARPEGAEPDDQGVGMASAVVVAADRRQVAPAKPEIESMRVATSPNQTTLHLNLKNSGGAAWRVKGRVTVRSPESQAALAMANLGEEVREILPDSVRHLRVDVPAAMGEQPWQAEIVLFTEDGKPQTTTVNIKPPAMPGAVDETSATPLVADE